MKPEYKGLPPKERVIMAGVALLRSGRRPTLDAILDEIGGGSKSTVNDHLPELWIRIAETLDLSDTLVENLPESAKQSFSDALRDLALSMKAAASHEFDAERQALQEQVDASLHEARTSLAEVAELRKALDDMDSHSKTLEAQLYRLQSDLDKSAASYEGLLKRHEEAKARIHDMERELLSLGYTCNKWESEAGHLTDTVAKLEGALVEKKETLNAVLSEAEQQASAHESINKSLRADITDLQERLSKTRSMLETSRIAEARYAHRAEVMEQALTEAKGQNASLESNLNKVVERNTLLERENAAAQAILTEYSARLEKSEDKNRK